MGKPEPGSLLKPAVERVDCPCGCGAVGIPRTKGNKPKRTKDGLVHTKNCDKKQCRYCRGGNVKRTANQRERRIARQLGGRRTVGSGARGEGTDITVALRIGQIYIEETTEKTYTRVPIGWAETVDMSPRPKAAPVAYVAADIAAIPYDDYLKIVKEASEHNDDEPGSHPYLVIVDGKADKLAKWWTNKSVASKVFEVLDRADKSGGPATLLLSWPNRDGGRTEPQLAVMRTRDLENLADIARMETRS